MYAYLTILTGRRAGATFPLMPGVETLLGRGGTCQVALGDPVCSREHARILGGDYEEDGVWRIFDLASRNGTFVNGQKIEEAVLGDGHVVRVGSTELEFHESEQPPTAEDGNPILGQTIVYDQPVVEGGVDEASLDGLPNSEQVKELMLLYQLCINLLGTNHDERLVRTALALLRKRTAASVVGFLWRTDEGELRPKVVEPSDAKPRVEMSHSLSELVAQAGHAVWVASQGGPEAEDELDVFADAICAPLVARDSAGERKTLGALHAYLEHGRFRQSDFDFLISVANLLARALARALELDRLQKSHDRLVASAPGYDDLIGESAPMLDLKSKIPRLAAASGAVLIRGESGAGKELVARAVHRASGRADRPMVAVNCAAIPQELMESQLFGHKAGSFTGADRDHNGFFQQADLGTLFLDEVGELTPEGQAKLLRVLEGHPFLPVGATEPVSVDVRVLAATNRDLQSYVAERRFREDLYYRLSVFELHLPALRERGDDVDRLIDFFLDHFRSEHGRPLLQMTEEARQLLRGYSWPGNVRQLRNVIDSAVVMADGGEIRPNDLALRDTSLTGDDEPETLRLEDWERKLIVQALGRTKGSVPEAAKLLGIGRATLYRKVEQYEIER